MLRYSNDDLSSVKSGERVILLFHDQFVMTGKSKKSSSSQCSHSVFTHFFINDTLQGTFIKLSSIL